MKLTKKLMKEIVLEMKGGIIRRGLKEPQEMTLNQLETFEDIILSNVKEGEQNDTINYFLNKIVDEIKIKSKKSDQLSLPLEKVASTKISSTKNDTEVNKGNKAVQEDKEIKEGVKTGTKTKGAVKAKKGVKEAKKDNTSKLGGTKEVKSNNKLKDVSKLSLDQLEGVKSEPLDYTELVKQGEGVILLLNSEYGVERIKIIDIDTDAKGKEYILIKSLDNKAVYDFIFKHKQVKNKRGTYRVKNSMGDIYSVTISKPL